MPRPTASIAALLSAALMLAAASPAARATLADDSRRDDREAGVEALRRGDGPGAAALLESALLRVAPAERPDVIADLRRAYQRAAMQAEAAGDDRRARAFLENMAIIDRSRSASERRLEADADAGAATPIPPATIPDPDPAPELDPEPIPSRQDPAVERSGLVEAASDRPREDRLRIGDAAFREGDYEEAGHRYAALAESGGLPASHHGVWAYCRFVAVAKRINGQPSSPSDWAAINAEIREVSALAPEIWFSDYLRHLAAERSAVAVARPSGYVVRGQSDPIAAVEPGPRARAGAWQVLELENYRVFHDDPALADRVARRAEQSRDALARFWTGNEPGASWTPRCDVYLYPDAATYARITGQPEDSPGFSTMGLSDGKVVARRINLRADAPELVEAVVPHEVAHVVLADAFPTRQVPRWADEGIAVLAEPSASQADRQSDLREPLASGRVFKSATLMTAPMPDGRYWDLYMAQSASLTRYLVGLDTPGRFLSFLRDAERIGPEAALQRSYGFESFDDLHTRWASDARRALNPAPDAAIAARPGEAERSR